MRKLTTAITQREMTLSWSYPHDGVENNGTSREDDLNNGEAKYAKSDGRPGGMGRSETAADSAAETAAEKAGGIWWHKE